MFHKIYLCLSISWRDILLIITQSLNHLLSVCWLFLHFCWTPSISFWFKNYFGHLTIQWWFPHWPKPFLLPWGNWPAKIENYDVSTYAILLGNIDPHKFTWYVSPLHIIGPNYWNSICIRLVDDWKFKNQKCRCQSIWCIRRNHWPTQGTQSWDIPPIHIRRPNDWTCICKMCVPTWQFKNMWSQLTQHISPPFFHGNCFSVLSEKGNK